MTLRANVEPFVPRDNRSTSQQASPQANKSQQQDVPARCIDRPSANTGKIDDLFEPFPPLPTDHSYQLMNTAATLFADVGPWIPEPAFGQYRVQIPFMPMMAEPQFNINAPVPFVDPVAFFGTQAYGVIKIKNIPFNATIHEVKQQTSRYIASSDAIITPHVHGTPLHIIMERATGKTMDCFVEFRTLEDAAYTVNTVHSEQRKGKAFKIGNRHCTVDISSQGELMSSLFPRAKSVKFDSVTGVPLVHATSDPFSEGFRGFITIEEMTNVINLAAEPKRSAFNVKCLQRPYESMISLLYKFPWTSTQYYTLKARDYIWSSYLSMLRILVAKVMPEHDPMRVDDGGPPRVYQREVGLSHGLLMDFLFAGLNVPAFNLRQKLHIAYACGPLGNGFPLTHCAAAWPFQCLNAPMGIGDDLLRFWLEIIHLGFDTVLKGDIPHGFERYIRVVRDNDSLLWFQSSDDGYRLHFQEAIALEQALMEMLVEKGRQQYCQNNGILYHPYNAPKPFAYAGRGTDMQATLEILQDSATRIKEDDKAGESGIDTASHDVNGRRHAGRAYHRFAKPTNSRPFKAKAPFDAGHTQAYDLGEIALELGAIGDRARTFPGKGQSGRSHAGQGLGSEKSSTPQAAFPGGPTQTTQGSDNVNGRYSRAHLTMPALPAVKNRTQLADQSVSPRRVGQMQATVEDDTDDSGGLVID